MKTTRAVLLLGAALTACSDAALDTQAESQIAASTSAFGAADDPFVCPAGTVSELDECVPPSPFQGIELRAYGSSICFLSPAGGVKCWANGDPGWITPGYAWGVMSDAADFNALQVLMSDGRIGTAEYASSYDRPTQARVLRETKTFDRAIGRDACAAKPGGGVTCKPTYPSSAPAYDVPGISDTIVSLVDGTNSYCALTKGGAVQCWEQNYWSTSKVPNAASTVVGMASGITAIAGGDKHVCAIGAGGHVRCWGGPYLGDGRDVGTPTPVDVVGLPDGIVSIAADGSSTCAITAIGGVKCWGSNALGLAGTGFADSTVLTAMDVIGLARGVRSVVIADDRACAVTASGNVNCWGSVPPYKYDGTAGPNVVRVPACEVPTGAVAVGSCDWTCPAGTVLNKEQWNSVGCVPVTPKAAAHIYATGDRTCAITTTGSVDCWGLEGQTYVAYAGARIPKPVVGLEANVEALSGATSGALALVNGGVLRFDYKGNVAPITGLPFTVAKIGERSSLAISSSGAVYSIAGSYFPAKGGALTSASFFELSGFSGRVASVSGSCAVTDSGALQCWGYIDEVAKPTRRFVPRFQEPSGITSGVVQVSDGSTPCVLTDTGRVMCWGTWAQSVGAPNADTPVTVPGLESGVRAISHGPGGGACAIMSTGKVKCWQRPSGLADVEGLDNVAEVVIGMSHTCARLVSGGVRCWGDNRYGQLGTNTPWDDTGLPRAVVGYP